MSTIHTLSPTTTKLLTATQTITAPLSIAKELLENAIDARATSVSIEISANTVDVLQVRDNGHGIAPKDRGMCCRRHTTSKLGAIEELGVVGGRSLGFRGEALFAVKQVSGRMEVVTRVEGEAVAVRMGIGREGEVVSRAVASAGIGTTVRVTDIFGTFPVRKQTAEKDASKCLAKIKKLLHAYALARPHVRLSLHVLKARNEKSNFSYAPKAGGDASVRDAAWKIVGSEPASQSAWFVLQAGAYEIQALLPTEDATAKALANVGHFLSVDQRPVSTSRGTLKQVSKLIVEKLKASNTSLANIRDPFFAVNIACPEGSYDPNVEPAKDDVLFHDADSVLKAIEELLSAAYPKRTQEHDDAVLMPELGTERKTLGSKATAQQEGLISKPLLEQIIEDIEEDGIAAVEPADLNAHQPEALQKPISPRPTHETSSQSDEEECIPLEPLANTNELEVLESRANNWRSTMYGFDDEEVDIFAVEEHEQADEITQMQVDHRDINPWTIARMRAARKMQQPHEPIHEKPVPETRARSVSPVLSRPRSVEHHDELMTPIFNDDMQAARSPKRRQAPLGLLQLSTQPRLALAYEGGLPTPFPSSSPPHEPPYQRPSRSNRNQRQKKATKALNQAFKPPRRGRDAFLERHESEPIQSPKRTHKKADRDRDIAQMLRVNAQIQLPGSIGEPEDVVTPSDADLEDEFRARLRQTGEDLDTHYTHRVMARHDEKTGGQAAAMSRGGWTPINTMPQHSNDTRPPMTTTPPPPPSKRRRTTESRRTKSSRWPLERVPDGAELHHLVQRVSLNPAKLESLLFHFAEGLAREVDYGTTATDDHHVDVVKRLEDTTLSRMSIKAVKLLSQKLHVTERTGNEDHRLALVRTLARLERITDVDE